MMFMMKTNETQTAIEITNTAPDLEADDLTHMSDRFWRKESARSDSQHSGLGLSVCESFAGIPGLTLTLSMDQNKHLTVGLCGISVVTSVRISAPDSSD